MTAILLNDLVGLRFKLRTPCRFCRCDAACVGNGQWKNLPLCCEQCDRERGRLTYGTQRFIHEFIKLCGRPTSPIEIRQSNYIETSLQPSGAGAETDATAPTRN